MSENVLLYVAALAVTIWGAAHIVKTSAALAGFEPLSPDNRRVLTMEWILEGVALCFLGVLIMGVTLVAEAGDPVARFVHRAPASMLLVMALISLFTGCSRARGRSRFPTSSVR